MDLNELQSVRDRERQTDKLQQLRESFYADAGKFIQQLHAERDRAVERTDDPFDSPEVRQLSDEIKTAEQTVEAIYEKRVGKIVKAASFAAADLPAEVEGMTAEEQALFDDLVGNIKQNRQRVLDLLDGEDVKEPSAGSTPASSDAAAGTPPDASPPDGAPSESTPQDRSAGNPSGSGADSGSHLSGTDTDEVTAADVMGGDESPSLAQSQPGSESPTADAGASATGDGTSSPETEGAPPSAEPVDPPVRKDGGRDTVTGETAAQSTAASQDPASGSSESAETDASEGPEVKRQRVQILDDVETFLGFDDRDYDLEPDDVVSLPATNADILLERGVAREL